MAESTKQFLEFIFVIHLFFWDPTDGHLWQIRYDQILSQTEEEVLALSNGSLGRVTSTIDNVNIDNDIMSAFNEKYVHTQILSFLDGQMWFRFGWRVMSEKNPVPDSDVVDAREKEWCQIIFETNYVDRGISIKLDHHS